MKIKQRFTLYNILLLMTPIIMIGVVSLGFMIAFIIKYPVEELPIARAALLNTQVFREALALFISNNPGAPALLLIWLGIVLLIVITTTSVFTYHMSRSLSKPIDRLTTAAKSVSSGNLDFEMLGSEYEEIDELCNEFDRMRQELKTAQRTEEYMKQDRSMLLANLSHDLKTPVTSIKGYVDGIRDGVAKTPEQQLRYLDTIYAKAQVIEELVNNLSEYSRLELRRMNFSFESCQLADFLKGYFDECVVDLEDNNIELKMDFRDDWVRVRLDREKMGRVFANLTDNAIKYKQDGRGCIFLKTYLAEGGVIIEFTDNGIGISRDELKKVFDSFYRVDESRSSSVKGSGLGLGIVRMIVESHGGRIWLRSDGEGTGTTAVIYLPASGGDI